MASRPTYAQLDALAGFLENNPGIAKGFLRTAQAKMQTKRKWDDFAQMANALGGVMKDGKGWAKVLIEKLLYHCPKVNNIYVLIREKKGNNANIRLTEITNSPIFFRLKQETPTALEKIKLIAGNIIEPYLGISDVDRENLYKEVSIVFHTAASVYFNDTLQDAFAVNVGGTREVLSLCRRMHKLQALIHVSTAFSNCDRFVVEEMVYPPPTEISTIEYLVKNVDKSYTKDVLGKHPNTYTYTKALAEHYVASTHGDIPVAIVRPSIVLSPLHEPNKGWVCNWNGPNGFISASLMKDLCSIPGNRSGIADFIPVDLVANTILISASRIQSSGELNVYNCCSGVSNPISWNDFTASVTKNGRKHSKPNYKYQWLFTMWFPTALSLPFVTIISNYYLHWILTIAFQMIPAFILYFFSALRGKHSRALNMQKKIQNYNTLCEFFIRNQFLFVDKNFRKLIETMTPQDRQTFDIDVKNINWDIYLEDYVKGLRKYLLKME